MPTLSFLMPRHLIQCITLTLPNRLGASLSMMKRSVLIMHAGRSFSSMAMVKCGVRRTTSLTTWSTLQQQLTRMVLLTGRRFRELCMLKAVQVALCRTTSRRRAANSVTCSLSTLRLSQILLTAIKAGFRFTRSLISRRPRKFS